MNKTLTIAAVALLGVAALGTLSPGGAVATPNDKVTICHVAGRADDPANYITLTIGWNAVYGPGGHFNENGTTQAGHEQDTLGECEPPPPLPVLVEVVEPTMTDPDCDAPGEVIVHEKTGLVYTQMLADGSVKVTVEADEGYVLAADSDTSWTFPAADLAQWAVDDPRCVESPPPVVTPPVVTPPADVVPPADVASAGPVPPVVTPPPAASVAAVTPAAAPTALPATGGMAWPIFLIGLASLVVGIGAVRVARRPA